MPARLALFAAALWWGSLTALGFVAVPLLFRHLPTPAMAGNMAAQLFTAQTWVSVACAAVLLLVYKNEAATQDGRARAALFLIVFGMLMALLVEFGAAPHIRARDNLALWHGLGTGMYALQWLCAAAVLWRLPADSGASA
jgi:hypothetical protein